MNVRWWSQPFSPEGSAAAEGIVRQLGRPALDPLTVLVREAAQNSSDAGRDDADVIDFRIEVRTLGDAVNAWRRVLLPGPAAESGVELEAGLAPETVILVVSDRNTFGLGGPIRADRQESGGRRSDFVQFLRNVGEPSDHELAGGTYGFGKGIFYRISRCGTILVDTHTAEPGSAGRRLMGAALGRSWLLGDRRNTGRHWWGRIADDGVPDPVLGEEAAAVADLLDLPGFADGRTGSDIVVVGADLGTIAIGSDAARTRTVQEAATYLQSAILWNLWPKFVPDADGRCMRFFVAVEGDEIEVPPPGSFPELEPFVESIKAVRAGQGTCYTRTRAPRVGGSFHLEPAAIAQEATRLIVSAACPFEGPPHHVARMRSVELVVDYVTGPAHPNPHLAYGAVFKASPDADSAFASAEPPTHDNWVATGLVGSAKGVVQGAKAFITKQLDECLGLGSPAGGGGQGLGQLASRLASVIPAPLSAVDPYGQTPPILDGSASPVGRHAWIPPDTDHDPGLVGAGPARAGLAGAGQVGTRDADGRSTSMRRDGPARLVGTPRLEVFDGVPYVVARVLVPRSTMARTITAHTSVIVEGGARETEVPEGALVPKVVQWQLGDGTEPPVHSHSIALLPCPDTEWWVYATHIPDAV